MKVIRTVCGDVLPDELGVAATHEHLWCDQSLCGSGGGFPSPHARMILQDQDVIVNELGYFYDAGGRAVVEMTLLGWGRDVATLRSISSRSGVHIVAASGFYIEDCHPDCVANATIDGLVDLLVGELSNGADGTDIRTGILKCAIGRPRIEGQEEKAIRAVARAQTRTGVAITTHTSGSCRFEAPGGNGASLFLDLFEEEGVDLSRVIIGHNDENADLRQLVAIAERGAYVQFDVIGKTHWLLDETRVDLLARLFDRGFGEHLLLSSDRCRTIELKEGGGLGYDYVLRSFVPRLREAGFDDVALGLLLVKNPARALAVESTVQ